MSKHTIDHFNNMNSHIFKFFPYVCDNTYRRSCKQQTNVYLKKEQSGNDDLIVVTLIFKKKLRILASHFYRRFRSKIILA